MCRQVGELEQRALDGESISTWNEVFLPMIKFYKVLETFGLRDDSDDL